MRQFAIDCNALQNSEKQTQNPPTLAVMGVRPPLPAPAIHITGSEVHARRVRCFPASPSCLPCGSGFGVSALICRYPGCTPGVSPCWSAIRDKSEARVLRSSALRAVSNVSWCSRATFPIFSSISMPAFVRWSEYRRRSSGLGCRSTNPRFSR